MRLTQIALWLGFAALVASQTETIVDEAGQTVVIVVTQAPDPENTLDGPVPTTTTISTIVADEEEQEEVEETTAPGGQNPYVGAPVPTDQEVTTTYFVSTTVDGVSTVLTKIFTPSFAPSSPPVQYPEGTIMDYDEWTAQYATRTHYPNSSADRAWFPPTIGWITCALTCLLTTIVMLPL